MAAAAAFFTVLVFSLLSRSISGETAPSLLDRHETQLARLETLVESLSKSVSRLESAISGATATSESPPKFPPNLGIEDSVKTGGVAVTKYKPSWPERFKIAAAAKLESEASAATVLPYEDHDGLSKYFAVGDSGGGTFVFSAAGDVLLELPPPATPSPATSMLAYSSSRRNESFLFTGHKDGSIFAHRISESTGEEWPSLSVSTSRSFLRGGESAAAILNLGVYAAGRVKYIAAADGGARIRVFTESGTLYGSAAASSPILAFSKHRLLFLTESGAGSIDLRTMAVKETNCEGLNGTSVISYAFDVSERSKAYGFTNDGLLVQIVLLGDAASIKCRVRAARKVEIGAAAALQTIRGYLIAADHEKVFVFNVSSNQYGRAGAPRPLFSTSLMEIRSLFLRSSLAAAPAMIPVMAADREKLLILGLAGGYVAIYRSNFPVYKAESSAVLWSSPVLVFVIFLIGIWHFYAKKKDVLGWSPEEFDQAAFGDGAAAGGGIGGGAAGTRGPARRFGSPPSRYGGAAAGSFRPGSADSGFRAGGDIKYRAAQRIEASGFPKRRDAIVGNVQSLDHID